MKSQAIGMENTVDRNPAYDGAPGTQETCP